MKPLQFAIVASLFNDDIVDGLRQGAQTALKEREVSNDNIKLVHVPGAYEIPLLAQTLAQTGDYAAIIALGCVIRGETDHFNQIVTACTQGLMSAMLQTNIPMAHAILAVNNYAEAERRSSKTLNRGREAAEAAWDMAIRMQEIKRG